MSPWQLVAELGIYTEEQIEEIKNKVDEHKEQCLTKEEIQAEIEPMIEGFITENLEDYLTEEQIDEILAKMSEVREQMEEIKDKVTELKDEGMTREEIRAEIKPLIEEAKELRGELGNLLDEYGIEKPPHPQGGPMGQRPNGCGGPRKGGF